MMIDISKLTLDNINDYRKTKFKTKKDELLYKLKQQLYVSNTEMKNMGSLVSLLRQEGYKIETIPKVGYRLRERR